MSTTTNVVVIPLTALIILISVTALGLAIDCEVNKVDPDEIITGPERATENALTRWSNPEASIIKDSVWLLSDDGILTSNTSQIDMSVDNKIRFIADEVQVGNENILTTVVLDDYVQGPASSNDLAIAVFNGSTGKYIQNTDLKIVQGSKIQGSNDTTIDMSVTDTVDLTGTNIQANGSNIVTNALLGQAMQIEDPSSAFESTTTGDILGTLQGSLEFEADFFKIGDVIRFSLDADITTDGDDLDLYFEFGNVSTNVMAITLTSGTQGLHVDGVLSCRSTSSWTITLNVFIMHGTSSNLTYKSGTMAVLSTVSNTFNIQAKWDTGSIANSALTCRNFNFYRTYFG